MGISLNLPAYSFRLPWFMFDLDNRQLILSKPIPGDITDSKRAVLTQAKVPGLNYEPVSVGGFTNRLISFTIPLIDRNNTVGNTLLKAQLDNLRNQTTGFLSPFSQGQFVRGPKVLYFWGVGSVPLEYYVDSVEFTHKTSLTNNIGNPQWTDAAIELVLDEESPLYQMEEMFRKVSSLAGMVVNAFNTVESGINNSKPF